MLKGKGVKHTVVEADLALGGGHMTQRAEDTRHLNLCNPANQCHRDKLSKSNNKKGKGKTCPDSAPAAEPGWGRDAGWVGRGCESRLSRGAVAASLVPLEQEGPHGPRGGGRGTRDEALSPASEPQDSPRK